LLNEIYSVPDSNRRDAPKFTKLPDCEITKVFQMKKQPTLQDKRNRIAHRIRALPPGTVSSYGAIARAAGWPGAARQVVRVLQQAPGLPWHRVVGAGGAIKLRGEDAAEQRFRLRLERVTFRGARVDMARHEFRFAKGSRGRAKR
jgi:methylated-DNA-protein-cysteine methyltransferase-like protein